MEARGVGSAAHCPVTTLHLRRMELAACMRTGVPSFVIRCACRDLKVHFAMKTPCPKGEGFVGVYRVTDSVFSTFYLDWFHINI